jgi:G:T-mismatch repair DNA endonuclease (very short patch repair protein)
MQPVTKNYFTPGSKNIRFVHVDRTGGYRLCIVWECDVYLVNNYFKTFVVLNYVANGI